MAAIRLYIEGQRVDWYDDEGMTLIQSIANVKDLTKLMSDYSKAFTLPASPTNNAIFEHYYDIDVVGNFNAHFKVYAVLEGVYINPIYGAIELQSVTINRGRPDSYMVNFYGAIKQLSDIIGSTKMDEIDWSSLNHTLNYTNVTNSWLKTLLSGDVVYPVIDWSRGWFYSTDATFATHPNNIGVAAGGITLSELKPAIRLGKMIELIFADRGLIATGSALSTPWIDDVYIAASKNAGYIFDSMESVSQLAYMNAQSTAAQIPAVIPSWSKLLLPSVIAGANPPYNPATSIYTAAFNGLHVWDVKVTQTGMVPPVLASIGYALMINGTSLQPGVKVHGNKTLHTIKLQAYLTTGDTVEFYAQKSTVASALQVDYIQADLSTFPQDYYGATINPGISMPSSGVIDFIRELREGYNMIIEYKGASTYEFTMFDDYYAAGNKVDLHNKVELDMVPMKKVPISKNIKFEFLKAEVYGNLLYMGEQDKEFGNTDYEPDVDFGTGELTAKLPFAVLTPTLLEDYILNQPLGTQQYTDLAFWNVLDKEGEPVHVPFIGMFIPDLESSIDWLYYMQNGVSGGSPTFLPIGNYPYASFANAVQPQVASTEALAFCIEQSLQGEAPTVTIFTEMWQRRVETMYLNRSRLVTYNAYVDVVLATEINLNDEIYIDGIPYTINEIRYDTLTGKMQLELLVLPLKYIANIITAYDTTSGTKFYTWSGGVSDNTLLKVNNLNSKDGGELGGTKKLSYRVPVSNIGTIIKAINNL